MGRKLAIVGLVLLLLLLVIPLGIGMVMAPCPDCSLSGAAPTILGLCAMMATAVAVLLLGATLLLLAREPRRASLLLLARSVDRPPRAR
jgi:hypothetical protein